MLTPKTRSWLTLLFGFYPDNLPSSITNNPPFMQLPAHPTALIPFSPLRKKTFFLPLLPLYEHLVSTGHRVTCKTADQLTNNGHEEKTAEIPLQTNIHSSKFRQDASCPY